MIELEQVSKVYTGSSGNFKVLDGITLRFLPGEFVAIVGKSTLINLIAGIDRPTDGMIRVTGTPVGTPDESKLAIWRGRHIGEIFPPRYARRPPCLSLSPTYRRPHQ